MCNVMDYDGQLFVMFFGISNPLQFVSNLPSTLNTLKQQQKKV